MSDFLKPKKIESVEPLQTHLNLVLEEVVPTQINITTGNQEYPDPEDIEIDLNKPKQINMLEEMANRLENCATISGIDDLKDKLTKLGIRFDTDPKLYQKPDFWLLICILYRALVHLYESNPKDIIVTDWLDPHSDDYIPSEKLVAETIDELEGDVSQEILDRILAVADEAALRLQGDQDLSAALEREVQRLEGLIGDINELIPEEASSNNQLADKEFVHDLIATNASNFRGDWANWSSVPTNVNDYPEDYTGNKKPNNNDYLIILNATDYGSSYTGIWRFYYQGNWDELGKSGWQPQYRVEQAFTQELLNAINSGITSGKVSTYDGYANSISTLLSNKVDKVYSSNKVYGTDSQGSLTVYTAGDGISFTNGLIVNTRTSAAWGNITGTLSDQTDLLAELDSCVTSEEVQSVGDVTAYVSSRIPVIDKTSDSFSSFAIDANKMYMFGTRSSLTITLNAGESGIVNEYMFQFTSGSTATTLNVPSSVTWLKDPDIQTNKKYAVSIENNLGVIGEWGNE